ncbi:MAG: hypothetical protein WCJ69_15730 [Betaproteobacteria bacterium]
MENPPRRRTRHGRPAPIHDRARNSLAGQGNPGCRREISPGPRAGSVAAIGRPGGRSSEEPIHQGRTPTRGLRRRLQALVARLLWAGAISANLAAASTDPGPAVPPAGLRLVACGGVPCGSMEIFWYREFRDSDPTPGVERAGVNIRGRFRGFREQAREFHFLQAITRFEADDFRWSRDPAVALPRQFVDAPPFGLRHPEADAEGHFRTVEHRFDALPWYDEGEFPLFDDRPRAFLASARSHGRVTMEFETWIVCVIDARPGPDPARVSDDAYDVAALLGWTWGYDIVHRDVGEPGVDEFEDYTFSIRPLRYVAQPSAAFEAALGATLGDAVTDRFDIRLGDPTRCPLARF